MTEEKLVPEGRGWISVRTHNIQSGSNVIPKKCLVFSHQGNQFRKVTMKSFRLYSLCLIFIVFVLFMVLQLIVLSQRKYGKYSDFHHVILTFFKIYYCLFLFFFYIDLFEFLAYSELIMLFMKCKDKKMIFITLKLH